MADRLINYLFGFVIIAFYVLLADSTERTWIVAALVLGSIAVTLIYLNNILSMDGAAAALVVGVISMGFGKITGTILILFFFISSYGISWWLDDRARNNRNRDDGFQSGFITERRNGKQVWANSFWFVLLLTLYFLLEDRQWMIAATAALAAATSDTWASIVGTSSAGGKTRLITTLRKVTAGTDGAVSYYGTIAAAAGAFAMTMLYLVVEFTPDLRALWIIFLSGFSGCVADSYLGATFQVHNVMNRLFTGNKYRLLFRISGKLTPDNNMVNFLATGIAALIALLLY